MATSARSVSVRGATYEVSAALRVISGAGCVEEFTPLDRTPGQSAFDARVRAVRGHLAGAPSEVVEKRSVVTRLIDFGREVAAEHGGTTVIDVALDLGAGNEGTPVVIELNELPNSGLYASDPWRVTDALLTAVDRGYSDVVAYAAPTNLTPVTAL